VRQRQPLGAPHLLQPRRRSLERAGVFAALGKDVTWLGTGGSLWHGFWRALFSRLFWTQSIFVFFLFISNFLIFLGPMMLMGISQIRGYEPGDAQWGVRLEDVRGQAEAKEEVRRVVKRGGRVGWLERQDPQALLFRHLVHFYCWRLGPLIGGRVAGDRRAYAYLPNSLTSFPAAEPMRELMLAAGYREVRYRRLMLGTVAVHVATV